MKPNNYKMDGCYVSHPKRFIFINIHRNGTASFLKALKIDDFYKYDSVKNLGYRKIYIVRDPLVRCISSYLQILKLETHGLPDKHPVNLIQQTHFYKFKDGDDISKVLSFQMFLDLLADSFFDAYTYPQTLYLKDKGLTIDNIDDLLTLAFVDDDFQKLKVVYNLDIGLVFPVTNESDKKERAFFFRQVVQNTLLNRQIKEIYKDDYELYEKVITLNGGEIH